MTSALRGKRAKKQTIALIDCLSETVKRGEGDQKSQISADIICERPLFSARRKIYSLAHPWLGCAVCRVVLSPSLDLLDRFSIISCVKLMSVAEQFLSSKSLSGRSNEWVYDRLIYHWFIMIRLGARSSLSFGRRDREICSRLHAKYVHWNAMPACQLRCVSR